MTYSYSWDDVIAILEQEMNAAGDALVTAAETISDADAFTRAMYDRKKEIDDACRFFAKNRAWPRTTPLIAFCVFGRVRRARDAARFFRGRSRAPFLVPSPKCSMRRMLEYLLVDHWRVYGVYKFPRL
jgi:hypothetical protein